MGYQAVSTKKFSGTPGTYTWLIPANLDVNTPVTVTLLGAGGGGVKGGTGEELVVTLDLSGLTPGVDTVTIKIGGKGGTAKGRNKGAGGVNGGGAGGNASSGTSGSGGGGYTAIIVGGVVQALAAGGGGTSAFNVADGGAGGTDTGQAGLDGNTGTRPGNSGGHGGTSSAGGVGGTSYSPVSNDGADGSSLQGGHGCNGALSGLFAGGGGGGGWFGGGGGGGSVNLGFSGGGAGGSGKVGPLATLVTQTRGGGAAARTNGSLTIDFNAIPNAPEMSAGGNYDFNNDLNIDFNFSDPDSGDTLLSADVQWQVGGGGWAETDGVTLTTLSDNRYRWVFTGGTVAIDGAVVEFQVRTTDSHGAVGLWSDSVFWTARDTPVNATITAPTTTIDSHDPVLSWNVPVAPYRYQVGIWDAAGTTLLVAYTKVLGDGTTTSFDTDLPEQGTFVYVNGTHYQLGVRWQQYDGVWSDWALTGSLDTEIDPPLAPTLALTVDLTNAKVSGAISNPGSDPHPPVHNDVYRTDVLTGEEIRIFTGVAIDGSFEDWTPGFNRDYSYIARAVTPSGASAAST